MRIVWYIFLGLLVLWVIVSPIAFFLIKRFENKPYSRWEDLLMALSIPTMIVIVPFWFLIKKKKGKDVISW